MEVKTHYGLRNHMIIVYQLNMVDGECADRLGAWAAILS